MNMFIASCSGKGGFLDQFLQYSYPLYMCFILPIIRIHDEKLG